MTAILIDARNAMFRFGFAHAYLKSEDGEATGALYGILGLLPRLKKKYPDGRFIMVWDGAGPTWRSKVFPEYKAARGKASPEIKEARAAIIQQIPAVSAIMATLGIPNIRLNGLEADDVIGMLSWMFLKRDIRPVVYSSDKDFIQLMALGVSVIRDVDKTAKLAAETPKSVLAKFGCKPEDVLLLRTLCGERGESSDGIPPVRDRMGPKTALKLLRAGVGLGPSNTLTALMNGPLRQEREAVLRNYRLTRILTNPRDTELSQYEGPLEAQLTGLVDEVCRKAVRKGPQRKFLEMLAALNMQEALGNRSILYRIQD